VLIIKPAQRQKINIKTNHKKVLLCMTKKQYQRSTGTKTLNPKKHSYVDKKIPQDKLMDLQPKHIWWWWW
jgi:hypothetical protein